MTSTWNFAFLIWNMVKIYTVRFSSLCVLISWACLLFISADLDDHSLFKLSNSRVRADSASLACRSCWLRSPSVCWNLSNRLLFCSCQQNNIKPFVLWKETIVYFTEKSTLLCDHASCLHILHMYPTLSLLTNNLSNYTKSVSFWVWAIPEKNGRVSQNGTFFNPLPQI